MAGRGANAPPSGGGAGTPFQGIDLAALKAVVNESVSDGIAKGLQPMQIEIGELKERVRRAEDARSSRAPSDEVSLSDSDPSDASVNSILDDEETYLEVDPLANKHWGAQAVANTGKFKPHRPDLYGNRAYMVLTNNGTDSGGTLAFAHSYIYVHSKYTCVAWGNAKM